MNLNTYIASRLHGHTDNWTREQWHRSFEAAEWFGQARRENPFPLWMDGIALRGDYETPAPSLFTCQDWTDWFALGVRHPEIQLNIDFDPAPSMGDVHDAYQAARGEGELLVVGYPGEEPGTFDISVEGIYLPKGHQYQKRVEVAFGMAPNFEYESEIGWDWFGGWP